MIIQHGRFRAELTDGESGVIVKVFEVRPCGWRGGKVDDILDDARPIVLMKIHEETLDCPFHVALDKVYNLILDLHFSTPRYLFH